MSLTMVTDTSFEKDVLKEEVPVLVDFWAEWCGPCRLLSPVLETLQQEFEGKVKICKVNIDDNPDSPTRYGVRSIPTLTLFKGGEAVSTQVGALPKTALTEWVKKHL